MKKFIALSLSMFLLNSSMNILSETIIVYHEKGSVITDADLNETVGDFEQKLATELEDQNVTVDQLVFEGTPLEKDKSLRDYNIKKGSALYLQNYWNKVQEWKK